MVWIAKITTRIIRRGGACPSRKTSTTIAFYIECLIKLNLFKDTPMKELEYPFDSGYLLKKKRSIKRQLLSDGSVRIKKKNRRSRRLNHE